MAGKVIVRKGRFINTNRNLKKYTVIDNKIDENDDPEIRIGGGGGLIGGDTRIIAKSAGKNNLSSSPLPAGLLNSGNTNIYNKQKPKLTSVKLAPSFTVDKHTTHGGGISDLMQNLNFSRQQANKIKNVKLKL